MRKSPFKVREIIFAHSQPASLESILMGENSLELIITLDAISALRNASDRSVALNLLMSQLETADGENS